MFIGLRTSVDESREGEKMESRCGEGEIRTRDQVTPVQFFENCALDQLGHLSLVHPAGIEPASSDPQSLTLSVELWVQ
jgi:hypothetical protein